MLRLLRRFFTSRWYVPLVLATWVLAPEVRRLYDWRTTFHQLSPISLLPLASLLPGLFLVPSQWSRLGVAGRRVARLWAFAFGYAYLIAFLTGSVLSATYALALFIGPLLFYALLAAGSTGERITETYGRIGKSLLWLAVISAIYGIWQYISPPPWDTYWAQQANIEGSQGVTESFGFRIFGTLNSTGPFAGFLMFVILINLPRLRLSRWRNLVGLVPIIIALALTSVRGAWVALVLGIVLYLLLSPQRRTAFVSLGAIACLFTLVGAGLLATVSYTGAAKTTNSLATRLGTFTNLGSDNSVQVRTQVSADTVVTGIKEPLGQGLGVVGTSTKLSGGDATALDNGYLARFLEMGVAGMIVYLIALVLGLVASFTSYRVYLRSGDVEAASIAAVGLIIQLLLLVLEVASDAHNGSTALFFWLSVFLASAYHAPSGMRVAPSGSRRGGALPLAPGVRTSPA